MEYEKYVFTYEKSPEISLMPEEYSCQDMTRSYLLSEACRAGYIWLHVARNRVWGATKSRIHLFRGNVPALLVVIFLLS